MFARPEREHAAISDPARVGCEQDPVVSEGVPAAPRLSYLAFRSGSVLLSSNSCATTEAMASTPAFPFGPTACSAQEFRRRFAEDPSESELVKVQEWCVPAL